ncbi:MAG: hypothetical protein V7756_08855 [Halopseudomonas sp.]|uniref:hypothetical protein n=1 Tax=Halopseudomonas sp. TaxID=2901191 RepID=UPI00300138D9
MSFAGRALYLLILVCFTASVSARDILVAVPATSSPLITEFAASLRAHLPDEQISVSDAPAPEATNSDLIITLGSERLDWRLQAPLQTPTIALYLNSHALPDSPLPNYLRVLLANPKPTRQLQLAKRLLPRLRTVGLLYSPAANGLEQEWTAAVETSGLQARSETATRPEHLTRALLQVLERSDVLMGIDDPAIYNADNLKTILLTSYSRNKVLIGPSAPFIEAGSLSTTYSTPQDMARSVAWLLKGREPDDPIAYPAYFSVLSNAQVARSLGLPVPDDAKLARELAELEQAP